MQLLRDNSAERGIIHQICFANCRTVSFAAQYKSQYLAENFFNKMQKNFSGGERGIRTLGTLLLGGLVNRCTRPLCDLSKQGNEKKFCGEGGIRTLGELPHDSFQDCSRKPLEYLSKSITCILYLDTSF
jgi:hypothetical protein